jgi:hypothetical protein
MKIVILNIDSPDPTFGDASEAVLTDVPDNIQSVEDIEEWIKGTDWDMKKRLALTMQAEARDAKTKARAAEHNQRIKRQNGQARSSLRVNYPRALDCARPSIIWIDSEGRVYRTKERPVLPDAEFSSRQYAIGHLSTWGFRRDRLRDGYDCRGRSDLFAYSRGM